MSNFFSKSKADMKFLFKKNSTLTHKGLKRKKRAKRTVVGLVLVLIQIIITGLFLINLISLDMLPVKYMLMLDIILLLLTLYNFTSQFTKAHLIGKILAISMSVVMLVGFLSASKLESTLSLITGTTVQTDTMDVIVLSSDSASSIKDTISYTYGYNSSVNSTVVTKAISDINADYNTTLSSKEYTSWDDLLNALYKNTDIKAIVINDSMKSTLEEQYEDFDSKTKVVGTVKITTEIKLSASDKKVNEDPFIIYLSGNDSEGEISSTGRSDVNILAVVNPKTRQILLVSTPRDYYIEISNSEGVTGKDKLTHAGNAGVEYSISALENLYGVSVDYYLKINFTGCVNIVDALGGITINSDVDFTNGYEAAPISYHFTVGANECDGAKTLAFVRERKAFSNGDFQRGKNQEAALQGIVDKLTSASILANYSSLLDATSSMMLTNMSTSTITALVKGQLSNMTSWNIQSYSVDGTTQTGVKGYVYGLTGMSVVMPDQDSIDTAKELMTKITNGEVFDVDEYTSAQ